MVRECEVSDGARGRACEVSNRGQGRACEVSDDCVLAETREEAEVIGQTGTSALRVVSALFFWYNYSV